MYSLIGPEFNFILSMDRQNNSSDRHDYELKDNNYLELISG